ncbi:Nn.00g033980.m01.CDS01 [Neocucurbitaria sp. VM-36]
MPPVAPNLLPHRALVDTFCVDMGLAEDAERVDIRSVVGTTVRLEEEEPTFEQEPKRALQPVPQYAVDPSLEILLEVLADGDGDDDDDDEEELEHVPQPDWHPVPQ